MSYKQVQSTLCFIMLGGISFKNILLVGKRRAGYCCEEMSSSRLHPGYEVGHHWLSWRCSHSVHHTGDLLMGFCWATGGLVKSSLMAVIALKRSR